MGPVVSAAGYVSQRVLAVPAIWRASSLLGILVLMLMLLVVSLSPSLPLSLSLFLSFSTLHSFIYIYIYRYLQTLHPIYIYIQHIRALFIRTLDVRLRAQRRRRRRLTVYIFWPKYVRARARTQFPIFNFTLANEAKHISMYIIIR